MSFDAICDRLEEDCPGAILARVEEPAKDPFVRVGADRLVEVMRFLKEDPALGFELLVSISGVDWSAWDPKKPRVKKGEEPPPGYEVPEGRFEVVYHLLSVSKNHRLVVKCLCEVDEGAGDLPRIPSICSLYTAADWHERETWDLMGIDFSGHPDQRRILCCEDWVGHPLRKDYVFPKDYNGISAE